MTENFIHFRYWISELQKKMAEDGGSTKGSNSLMNEKLLHCAAKGISSSHFRRLATGFLGFGSAELDNIERDAAGHGAEHSIFLCLLKYCQRNLNHREELPEVLLKAGKQEGLVRLAVINKLKGKVLCLTMTFKFGGETNGNRNFLSTPNHKTFFLG